TAAGGAGLDRIEGGTGPDALDGGAGDDFLEGGAGPDRLLGGEGRDIVSYSDGPLGVRVVVDALNADGAPGENDFVATDVEEVDGSEGDDVLIAAPSGTTL